MLVVVYNMKIEEIWITAVARISDQLCKFLWLAICIYFHRTRNWC